MYASKINFQRMKDDIAPATSLTNRWCWYKIKAAIDDFIRELQKGKAAGCYEIRWRKEWGLSVFALSDCLERVHKEYLCAYTIEIPSPLLDIFQKHSSVLETTTREKGRHHVVFIGPLSLVNHH